MQLTRAVICIRCFCSYEAFFSFFFSPNLKIKWREMRMDNYK
uniref:Uncharacterized protein n=1 Tax=Manihot esculenta TaxID=3983 RepID=A0A199UBV0_MANES